MALKENLRKINHAIFSWPFSIFFLFSFFSFLFLNSLLNKTYVTLPTLFSSFKLYFAIPFAFLSFILIPFLVALTINLSIIKFKELKTTYAKSGSFAIAGIIAGFLGGACPGCFVGLFPAFLGLFGVSASLGVLPLYGLEIQILSAVFLGVSVFLLTRENVCRLKIKN